MTTSNYLDPTTWRQTTAGGIPYRLVDRNGTFTDEDATADETFLVPSNRVLDFVNEIIPEPILFGDTIFNVPGAGMLGLKSLRAATIKWKGHIDGKPIDPFGADPDAESGTYQPVAEITVSYDTSKNNNKDESDPNDPQTFLEISASASGEYINTTAPRANWTDFDPLGEKIVNANAVVPVTLIVPGVEWTLRWPRIPYDYYFTTLLPRLRTKMGKVNSTAFTVVYEAPPSTMLFVGFNYKEQLTWRDGIPGKPPVTLELKFLEKNLTDRDGNVRGHQDFWRPGVGWQLLLINGTDPSYQEEDFNELFAVDEQ